MRSTPSSFVPCSYVICFNVPCKFSQLLNLRFLVFGCALVFIFEYFTPPPYKRHGWPALSRKQKKPDRNMNKCSWNPHSSNMYRMIKNSLWTWWLQYRKLQVMFKVSPASLQIFIDTPNCVLEDRVQYSMVRIQNVFCDGHGKCLKLFRTFSRVFVL
jgi:hypothetical protein